MFAQILNVSSETYYDVDELAEKTLNDYPKLKESWLMIQELIKSGKVTVGDLWHDKDVLKPYLANDTLIHDKGNKEAITDFQAAVLGALDYSIKEQAFTYLCDCTKKFDFVNAVVAFYAYMFLSHINALGIVYSTLEIEDKPMSYAEWVWFVSMSKEVITTTVDKYLNVFRGLDSDEINSIKRVADKMKELESYNELFAERNPNTPVH